MSLYINLPCQANYRLQQFTVPNKLPFTAICRVKQITVYSNLLWQENYRLQQFTVSSKLPLTAIYCVKQITVYSNLLCQANYRLQQFTVFNNISTMSWRSVLLVEKTSDLSLKTQTLSHKTIEYTSPWTGFVLTTLVVISTDCTGSCKFNYRTITAASWGNTTKGLNTHNIRIKSENFCASDQFIILFSSKRTLCMEMQLTTQNLYLCW